MEKMFFLKLKYRIRTFCQEKIQNIWHVSGHRFPSYDPTVPSLTHHHLFAILLPEKSVIPQQISRSQQKVPFISLRKEGMI